MVCGLCQEFADMTNARANDMTRILWAVQRRDEVDPCEKFSSQTHEVGVALG
jgi:hypothetical protein